MIHVLTFLTGVNSIERSAQEGERSKIHQIWLTEPIKYRYSPCFIQRSYLESCKLFASTPQVHTQEYQVLFRNNFALSRDIASSFKVRSVTY